MVARRLIAEALTRDKRQGTGWLVAAQIEERQGNDGLVGLALRRGIECAPHEAELYRALGEHLVGRGNVEDVSGLEILTRLENFFGSDVLFSVVCLAWLLQARQIMERGLEINPLHAPLYHSLAELEARVFNLAGLANLNKRAAKLFNSNALVPPQSSSKAWGIKIRMGREHGVPAGVTALAQKVGESIDEAEETVEEPSSTLESMIRLEDEVVKDLFTTYDGHNDTVMPIH